MESYFTAQLGILGAAWATNADFGVAALLNLFFLYKYMNYKMDMIHLAKFPRLLLLWELLCMASIS